MNGELILTSFTYDQGRVAINDSFSATAYFNNTQASGNVTGGTYYSGATPLDVIIQNFVSGVATAVQPGTNIATGGTLLLPTISTVASPAFNNFNASGKSQFSALTSVSVSGGTVSGGTLYSGSTNLYDIFCQDCGGGFTGWTSSTGVNSIIANNGTNSASGDFSIVGGTGNTASSSLSFIGCGKGNSITGVTNLYSAIVAGRINRATSKATFIGAGGDNVVSGAYSAIVGGSKHNVTGYYSFIGAGQNNTASANYSLVCNGGVNLASGTRSSILNGQLNTATTLCSTIINGFSNYTAGDFSTIVSGRKNQTFGGASSAFGVYSLASGDTSLASGYGVNASNMIKSVGKTSFNHSTVSGTLGSSNADADYSVILGGIDCSIVTSATSAVVLGMSGFTASSSGTTHMANSYIQGHLDMEAQTSFPTAKEGRMFYSAGTLHRMILFTGNTSSDWMVLQ